MRIRSIAILFLFVAAYLPVTSEAADRERKGFFSGLSGGLGSVTVVSGDIDTGSHLGPALAARIGTGISNDFRLALAARTVDASSDRGRQSQLTMALAATYFAAAQAPSFFVSGELGVTRTDGPYASIESAMGYGLGLGYEFVRRWSAEISYTRASDGEDSFYRDTVESLVFTIGFNHY